jgi:hypothetical protein
MKGGDFYYCFFKRQSKSCLKSRIYPTKNGYRLRQKRNLKKEINATLYGIAKELGINQSNATVKERA